MSTKISLSIATLILAILTGSLRAGVQERSAPPAQENDAVNALLAQVSPGSFSPPSVPDGEGAWAIRVVTGGGFDGRGRGNATVVSTGELQCGDNGDACSRKL